METLFGIAIGLPLALCAWSWLNSGLGRDGTDQPNGRKRSGLTVFTDHGTGVQYVGVVGYGLVPRLGSDGKPFIARRGE